MDEEKAFQDLKETLENEKEKVGITGVAERYAQFEKAYEKANEQRRDD